MTKTIAASFALSFVIVAVWAAQIVCYQEQTVQYDPLAPVTFTFTMASSAVQR